MAPQKISKRERLPLRRNQPPDAVRADRIDFKRQEMATNCTGEMQATGTVVGDAVARGNVRGQMDIKSSVVTMNIKFTSRWLSTACEATGKK